MFSPLPFARPATLLAREQPRETGFLTWRASRVEVGSDPPGRSLADFNKQGNFQAFPRSCNTNRFPCPPSIIISVDIKALKGFSHYTVRMASLAHWSLKAASWNVALAAGQGGSMCIPGTDAGELTNLRQPGGQLSGQQEVRLSP